MKNVLITGVTGFVGKNLVEFLENKPAIKLFGFSRDIENARQAFRKSKIQFVTDISQRILDVEEIDCIVHMAGIAHDLSGKYKVEDYIKANFENSKKRYLEFLQSSATTFIYISSIKAVADHADVMLTEEVRPSPSTPYGRSKLMAEQFILQNQVAGKKVYVLRPVMIHGPGNKGNLNLLYKFVKSGIPYPLGAYHNERSFLSIENFCWVIDQILNNKLSAGTYHLADDQFFSSTSLVQRIGDVIGKPVKVMHIPRGLIRTFARIGTLLHLPFNKSSLAKLTENMTVSNKKLLLTLGEELPVSAEEGLIKTIRSFDE